MTDQYGYSSLNLLDTSLGDYCSFSQRASPSKKPQKGGGNAFLQLLSAFKKVLF